MNKNIEECPIFITDLKHFGSFLINEIFNKHSNSIESRISICRILTLYIENHKKLNYSIGKYKIFCDDNNNPSNMVENNEHCVGINIYYASRLYTFECY